MLNPMTNRDNRDSGPRKRVLKYYAGVGRIMRLMPKTG